MQKVYKIEDGSFTEHHPVDAREIVREQPKVFTLQNPKGPKAEAADSDPEAAARRADAAQAQRDDEARIADEQVKRADALSAARKAALKAQDDLEAAVRHSKTNLSAAKKKEAEAAVEAAEVVKDAADSEVARLESGGELPQKVVLK